MVAETLGQAPASAEVAVPDAPGGSQAAGPDDDQQPAPRRSLSPSRAADFLTCPLLYRFRVIDRLPEPPSSAAARGTLVHAVLERLFDEPAATRSPQAAAALLVPQWERLVAAEPELGELFEDDQQRAVWLAEAKIMLDRYFTLEDPTRLEPAHRELAVAALLESGLALRGYIDRLDVSPAGEVRIVDYKTGTAPREDFEARALFQMRFYALVLWRTQGTVPRLLQLMYLGNGEIVRYCPDEADLAATERKINALWRAIERAMVTGDWRPRPGKLCDWCPHQSLCPAFGGTPPPLPSAADEGDGAGSGQGGAAGASPGAADQRAAAPGSPAVSAAGSAGPCLPAALASTAPGLAGTPASTAAPGPPAAPASTAAPGLPRHRPAQPLALPMTGTLPSEAAPVQDIT